MSGKERQSARSKTSSREFTDEAVRMVLDGPRPVAHLAKELGIHDTTLGNRVKTYKRKHGGQAPTASGTTSERELRLERENRKLRAEHEFPEKAAAFFAAEKR